MPSGFPPFRPFIHHDSCCHQILFYQAFVIFCSQRARRIQRNRLSCICTFRHFPGITDSCTEHRISCCLYQICSLFLCQIVFVILLRSYQTSRSPAESFDKSGPRQLQAVLALFSSIFSMMFLLYRNL